MKRILNKTAGFKLNSTPELRQQGGPAECYSRFKRWLDADGDLTFEDIAAAEQIQEGTVRRQALKYLWLERYQRINGCLPKGLALKDVQTHATTGIDAALANSNTATQITAEAYSATASMHERLLELAEIVINNIDPEKLRSISEIKNLIGLVNELQKAKVELATQLLGIEELAKAVHQLRKGRK